MKKIQLVCLSVFFLLLASRAAAQTTAFTYQGRLTGASGAVNAVYDLRFTLYDALQSGTVLGTVTNSAVAISNGLFTVQVNFGSNPFDGSARWLEIGVRTNGFAGDFATLSPRQPLTSQPYALRALNATSVTGTVSPNNIANNSIDASKLATGSVTSSEIAAGAVTTTGIADGAVTVAKLAQRNVPVLVQSINNPFPFSGSTGFGMSASSVGDDRVAIASSGAAYLFSSSGTLLTTMDNPGSNNGFGISTATSTGFVVVGANFDLVSGTSGGSLFIFSTNGSLIKKISNPQPTSSDQFGRSVAAVGNDRVLVGAPRDDEGTNDSGMAYLFSTNASLLHIFNNPAPSFGANFGQAVATMGTSQVLISAPGANRVYLFSTNGTLLTTLTNGSPDSGFGFTVVPFGTDKVLISASNDGVVYLMSTTGTTLATFADPTSSSFEFGNAITPIGDDQVLIGASWEAGAAFLFNTNGALLTTLTNPTSGEYNFGSAVAALGNKLVVGAKAQFASTTGAGVAHVFSVDKYVDGMISAGVRPGGVTAEMLATSAVDSRAILDGTIMNVDIASNAAIADTKLAAITTAGKVANSATTATSANTANTIVARDASGNFSAGAITANGSALTALNASALASGTMPDARLSANVPLLNNNPTFSSTVSFNNPVQVRGGLRLNDTNIWLRSNTDFNHGLGWHGGTKPFAGFEPDGPVLFGWEGGALGSMNGGQKVALSWDASRRVGIGANEPSASLHVSGSGGDTSPQGWFNQETESNFVRVRLTVSSNNTHRWDIGAISNSFNIFSGFFGANMLVLNNSGLTVRGTFVSSSDRNAKEKVTPVDPLKVLEKLTSIPISEWNYKDAPETRHVGPMAQDFHAAFAVGTDDKHISMVDADGVALAAIQGLNKKMDRQLQEKAAEIETLRRENESLQKRLERLEQLLER